MYEKWIVSSFIRVILEKEGGGNEHEAHPTYRKYIRIRAFIYSSRCFSCDRAKRLCPHDVWMAISLWHHLCHRMLGMAAGRFTASSKRKDCGSKNDRCLSGAHFPCEPICCERRDSISRAREHRTSLVMDEINRTTDFDWMGHVHCET